VPDHILGINSAYHEPAACLLRDGQIVAMAKEERFNRIRHGKQSRVDNPDELPEQAIAWCLHEAAIAWKDLAAICVLLKPLDTGEREAIEDAVLTARKVFGLAAARNIPTRIALEPCFVAPHTPLHRAFDQGRYRPPWLWSVIEVLWRITPLGPVSVGLSDEGMAPRQGPHNCEPCTPRLRAALAVFNRTQDPAPLRELACECRDLWRRSE
jgi:radical SAM enzyme (TIGR01210 family)